MSLGMGRSLNRRLRVHGRGVMRWDDARGFGRTERQKVMPDRKNLLHASMECTGRHCKLFLWYSFTYFAGEVSSDNDIRRVQLPMSAVTTTHLVY